MPSMVVTLDPAAWPASTVQDFTALPSIWTTQAPHWLVSQPTWVPVRFRFSRKRWTRRVRSSTLTETALLFTVSLTVDMRKLRCVKDVGWVELGHILGCALAIPINSPRAG